MLFALMLGCGGRAESSLDSHRYCVLGSGQGVVRGKAGFEVSGQGQRIRESQMP